MAYISTLGPESAGAHGPVGVYRAQPARSLALWMPTACSHCAEGFARVLHVLQLVVHGVSLPFYAGRVGKPARESVAAIAQNASAARRPRPGAGAAATPAAGRGRWPVRTSARRPGAEVAEQLLQIPLQLDGEGRHGDAREGRLNVLVAGVDAGSAGGPVATRVFQ